MSEQDFDTIIDEILKAVNAADYRNEDLPAETYEDRLMAACDKVENICLKYKSQQSPQRN